MKHPSQLEIADAQEKKSVRVIEAGLSVRSF